MTASGRAANGIEANATKQCTEYQIDFAGLQRTRPWSGFVCASRGPMRSVETRSGSSGQQVVRAVVTFVSFINFGRYRN